MKFYWSLCLKYQVMYSTRWLCLMVWYFQTENLCSMWSSCFLSDFYCPKYIDFNKHLVCLHYWCRNSVHICLLFNMLFDLLRRNMFSPFNHFLQVNNCSQFLQLCPWLSFRRCHNVISRNDLFMFWKNWIFLIRQQKICFMIIHKRIL